MKHLNQVKELAEVGVDEDEGIVRGLHGTSVEAIAHLARFGELPSAGAHRNKFFFYQPEIVQADDLGAEDGITAMDLAKYYAGLNAVRWHVYKRLVDRGFVMNAQMRDRFMNMWDGYALFNNSGVLSSLDASPEYRFVVAALQKQSIMSGKEFDVLYREVANIRKGVVVGINATIESLKPYDGGAFYDSVVDIPGGLPIEYICGIEPMGQFEWDEITKNDLANVMID